MATSPHTEELEIRPEHWERAKRAHQHGLADRSGMSRICLLSQAMKDHFPDHGRIATGLSTVSIYAKNSSEDSRWRLDETAVDLIVRNDRALRTGTALGVELPVTVEITRC